MDPRAHGVSLPIRLICCFLLVACGGDASEEEAHEAATAGMAEELLKFEQKLHEVRESRRSSERQERSPEEVEAFLVANRVYATGDFDSARELFEKGCAAGPTDSCMMLAVMLESGQGGTPDGAGARAQYGDTCEAGNTKACLALGQMLAQGRGGPPDPDRAREVVDRACADVSRDRSLKRQCERAQRDMKNRRLAEIERKRADLLDEIRENEEKQEKVASELAAARQDLKESGADLAFWKNLKATSEAARASYQRSDFVQARELSSQVCEMRSAPECDEVCQAEVANACGRLGYMFWAGEGGPKDLARARALYQMACDKENKGSCFNLGVVSQTGQGGPTDLGLARSAFDTACRLGDTRGCDRLKHLGSIDRNREAAAARLKEAERRLGIAEEDLRARKAVQKAMESGDFVLARKLAGGACDRGRAHDCLTFGYLLENGMGGPTDGPGARARYEQGCTAGVANGCFALGDMLAKGRGGPADSARAEVLFDKACADGARNSSLEKPCKRVEIEREHAALLARKRELEAAKRNQVEFDVRSSPQSRKERPAASSARPSCTIQEIAGSYESQGGPMACVAKQAHIECCYGANASCSKVLAMRLAPTNELIGEWRHSSGERGPARFPVTPACDISDGSLERGGLSGLWKVARDR